MPQRYVALAFDLRNPSQLMHMILKQSLGQILTLFRSGCVIEDVGRSRRVRLIGGDLALLHFLHVLLRRHGLV